MRFCLVLVLAVAWPADSALAQSTPITLDEAVRRAVQESHRVAELRARGEGAQAAAEGRAAGRMPQVALQGGYTRTNHVDVFGIATQPGAPLRIIYPDIPDNARTRLDVSWPLYTGGRLESLTRAARAEAAASAQDVASLEADVRLETTRAYWGAVTASESARVTRQALERTDAHLKDLRVRLDTGLIPPNDVLSAEAQRAHQQVQVIEAEHAADLSLADLRRLVGMDADVPVSLATPLAEEAPAPSLEEPLPAQIDRALAARPERAALLQRVAAATARTAAANAGRMPAVSFNGGVDYARPNPRIFPRTAEWRDSWDLSVNASWSLWDGGRRGAEVGEAAAAEHALQARVKEFDSLVALDVRQRRLAVGAARAAVNAAAEGIRSATEARRVVGERFNAGVATSTDVLEAQVALLQAELDRTRALAAVKVAEAQLRRALGQ